MRLSARGIHDFVQRELHIGERPGERGAGPEGIVEAENPFHVLPALVIALVEEAKCLSTKSGRAAGNIVVLAAVAGGVGHGMPPKFGLSAVSH
jgi:hypothetical protein